MRAFTRLLLLAALLLVPAPSLLAQTAVDPSGHWEGSVQAPNMEVTIEIDLAKNSKGELAGTFGQPAQDVKGLPLSTVAVEGRSVRFAGQGSASGERHVQGSALRRWQVDCPATSRQGGYAVPFSLTRTGDARIAAGAEERPDRQGAGRHLERHAGRRRTTDAARPDDGEST